MKGKLAGKTKDELWSEQHHLRGFSTLEIIIALALMLVVISGAVQANISSQYWSLASITSNEALYKAKTLIEEMRATAEGNFQDASSTVRTPSRNPLDGADASCIAGGLCYLTEKKVIDISSCSKFVEAYVEWRIAPRYGTTTESLFTNVTDNDEITAEGGDCLLNTPSGAWLSATPSNVGSLSWGGVFSTGIDVLQKKVYVTASDTSPLRIYSIPPSVGNNPVLLGSSPGHLWRLNGLDAVRDVSTGRLYVYATQHASTSQLAVFDVTDASNPTLVSERSLSGVVKTGSFPEGWRVVQYHGRLYVTTRETMGPEFHIFNSNAPTQPTEITSAATELNRTVNDMVVREEKIGGTLHRYLYLAASAGLKELGVFDVTGDTPTEVSAIDLPGSIDARSIALTGDRLYVGRASGSGPELFMYSARALVLGSTTPLATSEVGADVHTIHASGELLFLGTGKSGEELQVWKSDTGTWSASTPNAGRVSFTSMNRLAPRGIDVVGDFVYALSQSASQPESINVYYAP